MTVEHDGLRFERLGHASVRMQTAEGTTVYVDPWSEVVEANPVPADLVFVTHDDYDHFDPDAITAVANRETTVIAYEDVETNDLDRKVVPLAVGDERDFGDVHVRALPAHNESDGPHVREDGTPYHAEGDGMALLFAVATTTVFFPSDTDFLETYREIRADVLLPPIGGTYTMDRHEAGALARAVDAALVLPVHYDTFEAIRTDAEAFREDVETADTSVILF